MRRSAGFRTIKNNLEKSKFDELWTNHVYSELDVHFITKMIVDPNNNMIAVTLSNFGLERVENWSGEFLEEMYVDKDSDINKLVNKRMFHTKTSTPYQFTSDMDFEFVSFNDKFC